MMMSLKLNDLPIYGRDDEIETLNKLFHEGRDSGAVLIVDGKPGCGKSKLIESNRDAWSRPGCIFVSGKFDSNMNISKSETLTSYHDTFSSGIIKALRNLIDKWIVDDIGYKEVQNFVPKMILDRDVLCTAIPKIAELYKNRKNKNNNSHVVNTEKTQQQQQQRKNMIKRTMSLSTGGFGDITYGDICRVTYQLLSYLCSPSRRIILFLDDIEFADTISVNFLNQIAEHPEDFNGLFLILSYGGDEKIFTEAGAAAASASASASTSPSAAGAITTQKTTTTTTTTKTKITTTKTLSANKKATINNTKNLHHSIKKTISVFEQSKIWKFHHLYVDDLNLNVVNEIVSNILLRQETQSINNNNETLPLSKTIYSKVGGNMFCILQFIQLLVDKKMLFYSIKTYKWEWSDINIINRTMNILSDDIANKIVIEILKNNSLDGETLQVLMVSSCFSTSEIPLIVLTEYFSTIGDGFGNNISFNFLESEEEEKDGNDDYNDIVDPLLTSTIKSTRLIEILESCLKAGILGQQQENNNHTLLPYIWLHDKIQYGAYSMIPESSRIELHYRLGDCLSRMYKDENNLLEYEDDKQDDDIVLLSSSSSSWMLYMAADQYNRAYELKHQRRKEQQQQKRGTLFETQEQEKDNDDDINNIPILHCVNIANLNLQAAKLSISKSAFYPAIDLLRASLCHLDKTICWIENYNLTLDIYSSLAETNFLIGNHQDSIIAMNEVLANARTCEDKFRVQQIQIKSTTGGSNRDYNKGLELALRILNNDYKEILPRKPSTVHMYLAKRKLRSLLPDEKFDKLLELKPATNKRYLIIGKLLDLVGYCAVPLLPDTSQLIELSVMHAIQLSMKYGISGNTALSIKWLAILLKNENKLQEAYEHAKLAISICDNFSMYIQDETKVLVKGSAYSTIKSIVRPFHESLEMFLSISQNAFKIGDTEVGTLCGMNYCITYLCMGLPLDPILSDITSFANDSHQFHVPYTIEAIFYILQQTIFNLQQHKNDSKNDVTNDNDFNDLTRLKGDAMDQDDMLEKLKGHGYTMTLRDINTFRLFLACIFRNYDMMEEIVDEFINGTYNMTDQMYCRIQIRLTFLGLACFALGRYYRRYYWIDNNNRSCYKKYLNKGKEILKQLRAMLNQGSMNVHPIIRMLEAEEHPSKEKFDTAISICARSGLIHYEAYMYESAGLYFLQQQLEEELDLSSSNSDDNENSTSTCTYDTTSFNIKNDNNNNMWRDFYIKKAVELYDNWGASKKVKLMKCEYEFLTFPLHNNTSGATRRISRIKKRSFKSLKGRSRHSIFEEALKSFKSFSISR